MGFFDSLVSGISNAISAICSIVLGPVAGALVSDTIQVITKLAPVIKAVVVFVVETIADILGIKNKDEKIDEIGDRALQASEKGIKKTDFETHDEYMNALREFELDPEFSKKLSKEDKEAAGLAVLIDGIDKKLDFSLGSIIPIIAAGYQWMTGERTIAWIEQAKAEGMDMNKVKDYLDGKIGPSQKGEIIDFMVNAERRINPDATWEDIKPNVKEMQINS